VGAIRIGEIKGLQVQFPPGTIRRGDGLLGYRFPDF
jgi:hypothetical protein